MMEPLKETIKLSLERWGLRAKRSFGLNRLDVKLAEHIKLRNGFFVEAGANNGIVQSNTAYLERYLGWRGLLIEAIPDLATQCRINRPSAMVEQCALVSNDYDEPSIRITYCNLMSVVRGARGSAAADFDFLNSGKQHLLPGENIYDIEVPAKSLATILSERKISSVDLLSLDVEGYEAQVLNGLDLKHLAPTWILVEANYPEEIDAVLRPLYLLEANLSVHDRLYRLKSPLER